MSEELVADFEKRFQGGAIITARLKMPIHEFSTTVLFGPSGCGKTTILRSLAGLERPEAGTITFDRETWLDANQRTCKPPQQRRIGFLFQDYALFPHLTVSQNVGYSLRTHSHAVRRTTVIDLMETFQLNELKDRLPHQISAGQQQRVALARVLANRPRLLLLDEPLSALDETLCRELRSQLRRIMSSFAIPVIVVTHNRLDAMALADRMVVMEAGRILQEGLVEELFRHPAEPAVARIIGTETVEEGTIVSWSNGQATVAVGHVHLDAVAPSSSCQRVHVCIKGEDVILQRFVDENRGVRNQFPAKILSITPEGPLMRVGLDCGFELSALVTRATCDELHLRESERVIAYVVPSSIHLIPEK